MLRRWSVPAALSLGMITSGSGFALGLGAIRVESGLNEPFTATIPFTSLSAQEAESLRVRIADNEDFTRAGIDRSAYLSTMTIEVAGEGGAPRLVIRSQKSAREPLLTLLIDVRAGGPKMLREYNVFLDPPDPARARPAVEAAPAVAREPASRRPAAVAAAASAPVAAEGQYGPVRSGEVLWKIAEQLRPQDGSVSLDQAVLALYKANPRAFVGGNINHLVRDVFMRVPDPADMRAVDPAQATQEVRALAATPIQPANTTAAAPALLPQDAAPAAATPTEASVEAPSEAAAVSDDSVDASSGADAVEVPTDAVPEQVPSEPASSGQVPSEQASSASTPAEPTEAEPAAAEPAKKQAGGVGRNAAAVPAAPAAADNGEILAKMVPALLAVLALLIGVLVWRARRQKRAQAEYEAAARAMTAATAASAVAASHVPVPRVVRSVREDLEEVDRKLAEAEAAPVAPAAVVEPLPPLPSLASEHAQIEPKPAVDFDATAALQADTFEIDLSDNDPVSEAEFHLAYGLYDEAALLLRQAAEKEPERTDLRVKLAETYFAAGKAAEFEQTAETLIARLDRAGWEKLAIMGRQLCPDAEMFKGGYSGSSISLDLPLDGAETREPAAPPPAAAAHIDEGLDFKLEELELPSPPPSSAPPAKPARPPSDFDLGEFDLGDLKLDTRSEPVAGSASAAAPAELELKLDEFESDTVLEDPFGTDLISAGDDVGTKLDLARAYVEMGDLEMARSLLDEVDVQGSDEQKRESSQLRDRMVG